MDKKKLAKYKEMLLKSKAEILHEIELENENIMYSEQGDLVDIADVVINNELMNRLSDMDFEKIKLIDRALEKIEDGSYGTCEGTGKVIPEARLNAIPWTPYTVDYAEQVEKQRKKAAQIESQDPKQ
ncbi:MAG: molecular chaperone DnaK [Leptospiraceae bacterium]|nr:molecular chaperone DnaK [Leptospiraceae bacterium]